VAYSVTDRQTDVMIWSAAARDFAKSDEFLTVLAGLHYSWANIRTDRIE